MVPPKVVLAYSGGLDTSIAIPWLKEKKGFDVVAVTVDVGQPVDLARVRAKATASGAVATLPPGSSTPIVATPTAQATGPTPTAKPQTSLIGRIGGAVLHFPIPLLFEVLFVALLVFLWVRWRRHYYVDGPP